jgi:predicted transcriptional regulator
MDDFLEGFPSVIKERAVAALDARAQIEAGIADLNAGRRHSHDVIKREFCVK